MAKEAKPKIKFTPAQHAVKLNSGAANAAATGNLIEGMDYTHSQSRDLKDDPIVQVTMATAEMYLSKAEEYQTAHNEWKNTPEKDRGDEPKLSLTHELIGAQAGYENVMHACEVRANKFHEFYNSQTRKEAIQSTFYGNLPRSMSDEAKQKIESIDENKVITNLTENSEQRKTMDAIIRYHVLGKTKQGIEMNNLEKALTSTPQPTN